MEDRVTACSIIYATVADREEARRIVQALLTERLIACANLLGLVESHYWWEGKLETATEVALVMKTQTALVEAVTKRVCSLHSYTCPAIVALPIVEGNPSFLDWIVSETRM
jgi:periplasmic divalent cation tolerance protein